MKSIPLVRGIMSVDTETFQPKFVYEIIDDVKVEIPFNMIVSKPNKKIRTLNWVRTVKNYYTIGEIQ